MSKPNFEAIFAHYATERAAELVERVDAASAKLDESLGKMPTVVEAAIAASIENKGGEAVESWLRRLDAAAAERLVAALSRRFWIGLAVGLATGFLGGLSAGLMVSLFRNP